MSPTPSPHPPTQFTPESYNKRSCCYMCSCDFILMSCNTDFLHLAFTSCSCKINRLFHLISVVALCNPREARLRALYTWLTCALRRRTLERKWGPCTHFFVGPALHRRWSGCGALLWSYRQTQNPSPSDKLSTLSEYSWCCKEKHESHKRADRGSDPKQNPSKHASVYKTSAFCIKGVCIFATWLGLISTPVQDDAAPGVALLSAQSLLWGSWAETLMSH